MSLIESRSNRIPIYISLRGKSPRNNTPLEILAYFASENNINLQALQILNNNGRLLLIFDGFDEMDYIGDVNLRQNHFKSIWNLAKGSTKMIITGRPNFFFDTDEISNALGSNIRNREIRHCAALRLCPFDRVQIDNVLSRIDEETRIGITTVLDKVQSSQFMDLISRPSNLSLVIQIWKPRNLIERYNNLSAASVLDEFVQNSYDRQIKRNEQTAHNMLSPIERDYFMLGIALKMYALQTLEINRDLLDDTFSSLAEKFPDEISKYNPVYINLRNGSSLRDYLNDKDTREAILTDIRTCGVLVLNKPKNIFEFAHKSFYDLLVAKCFLGQYLPNDDPYHKINTQIFSQSGVSIKKLRGSDITQKKLLAELLIQAMHDEGHLGADNPKVIFQQCYRFIISHYAFSKPDPSKEYKRLKRLSKSGKVNADDDDSANWFDAAEPRKEIRRFFVAIISLFSVCLMLFGTTAMRIVSELGEMATDFYTRTSTLAPSDGLNDTLSVHTGIVWIALIIITILVVIMIIFHAIYKRFNKRYIENINVLFFTWFYALKERNMDNKEILSHISGSLQYAFEDYITAMVYDGTDGAVKYLFDDFEGEAHG